MSTDPFVLTTLDGVRLETTELQARMQEWLDEQQIAAEMEVKRHFLFWTLNKSQALYVAIADENHRLWFKMRWSNDLARYAEAKRKSEDMRAQFLDMGARNQTLVSTQPIYAAPCQMKSADFVFSALVKDDAKDVAFEVKKVRVPSTVGRKIRALVERERHVITDFGLDEQDD